MKKKTEIQEGSKSAGSDKSSVVFHSLMTVIPQCIWITDK